MKRNSDFGLNIQQLTLLLVLPMKFYLIWKGVKLCGAVFLDLSKAFDMVDYTILLRKLPSFGVTSDMAKWFESYLNGRMQCTSCGLELSDLLSVMHGVPQGRILGPLLFLIYINDLPTVIKHSEEALYADDAVLYCYDSNPAGLECALNADLHAIASWLNDNKLTLNVDKTKAMLIGSDSKLCKLNSLSVFVLGNQLDSVRSFKYLGVVLSSNFTWTEYVAHVISKVNQRLGLLCIIKHLLPYNACLPYYKSLVLPILDYADMVWGDKDNTVLMNNLQVLQNKAAKLVLDKPLYSSATDALNQLSWLNLKQRRHFHRCLYVYKCVNGITSHKLELSRNSDVHRYNTCCKDHLKLSSVKQNWGKQRTCYHAFKDWNALDSDLKNSGTICQFRNNFLKSFNP